jgi:thiamine-monophosphate kinase
MMPLLLIMEAIMQVITTDLLLEGVHFDLVYTPLKHLGYKAVVVNLSDVYAMNAAPRQITVSLGISGKFSVEALEEFYAGVKLACERFKVDLVGGDTSGSMTGLVISVTAIGTALKEELKLTQRSQKQPADLCDRRSGSGLYGVEDPGKRKAASCGGSGFSPS